MPLLHCNKCHHEWEGDKSSKCDWCGGGSHILEPKTSFEKFCGVITGEKVRNMIKKNTLKGRPI